MDCNGRGNGSGRLLVRGGTLHIVVEMEGRCNGRGGVTVMGAVIVDGL